MEDAAILDQRATANGDVLGALTLIDEGGGDERVDTFAPYYAAAAILPGYATTHQEGALREVRV